MDERGQIDSRDATGGQQHRTSKIDRSFAAQHLKACKNQILRSWESEVRNQVQASNNKTSPVLSNTLPVFLDELVAILGQERPEAGMISMQGMSEKHGAQRATMSGYFLPQLLLEFSILREVINRELFTYESLNPEVPMTVNKVIDSAITLSATEFARIQSESLRSALAKAESSNRDLEEFAAVAAHDLKSPLATVLGFVDLLSEQVSPAPNSGESQSLGIIKATLERMTKLIDQLLAFAQIADSDAKFRRVQTSDVLRAAIYNLQDAIEKSGAKITSGPMPAVWGDDQLLTQVFQNLISNAIKFRANDRPEVHLACESHDGSWIFSLKDNGVGFDPKYKDQIFGLYKRLATPVRTSGSGIGLATCRKVIERHDGKIWAESELGKGSTFYFTLPKFAEGPGTH